MAGSHDMWGPDQWALPWPQALCQRGGSPCRAWGLGLRWPCCPPPPVLRGARGSSPGAVRWGGRAPGRLVTALSSADREFIEARRRALKRFINLVARHPPFSEDVVLKLFLSFSGPVSTSGTGGPAAPGHAGACRCGAGPR